jgi:hypothetical protein
MGQDKKTPITVNDVEYMYEDLTDKQKALFNHCVDLDRKIGSAQFNLDQLQVGKKAFIDMLEQSLKTEPEVVPAEAVVQ